MGANAMLNIWSVKHVGEQYFHILNGHGNEKESIGPAQ